MAPRRFGIWPFWALLLALPACAGGCHQEDAERMARVGRKVTAQVEAWTADQDGGLNKRWQAICGGWQETTLAGRVAARLRWDKNLAGAQVHPWVTGNVVELKGTVRDPEQRRQALDLAEATIGVEKVIDALEVVARLASRALPYMLESA